MKKIESFVGQIINGDCLVVMKEMPSNSITGIITDPPYGLEFMGKEWDKLSRNLMCPDSEADKKRVAEYNGNYAGRRSKLPDLSKTSKYGQQMQEWHYEWAKEALRIVKAGGFLLAFGGTRTYHRLACAIEDAGWEIRDMIEWCYSTGFPKSRDIGKDIEKRKRGGIKNLEKIGMKKGIKVETGTQGFSYMGGKQISGDIPIYKIENDFKNYGTALKPAHESIVVAMKPFDGTFAENALAGNPTGINVDAARIKYKPNNDMDNRNTFFSKIFKFIISFIFTAFGQIKASHIGGVPSGRFPSNLVLTHSADCVPRGVKGENGTETVADWDCVENCPIRKMDLQSIEGGIHGAGHKREHYTKRGNGVVTNFGGGNSISSGGRFGDSGGASRFFHNSDWQLENMEANFIYAAKPSRNERNLGCEGLEEKEREHSLNDICSICGKTIMGTDGGHCKCKNPLRQGIKSKNNHPTVKPIKLMAHLVRLLKMPQDTLILDPFAGSGSTLIACHLEGVDYVGIEQSEEYCAISRARLAYWQRFATYEAAMDALPAPIPKNEAQLEMF